MSDMVLSPSKIVCVGRNYADHAREMGNEVPKAPLLFLKPPSAIIAHGDPIVLPEASSRVEFEAEIGVVVGHRLHRVNADDAESGIGGFVCLNDVTARDLQKSDGQWTRAKGFDTFCPLGPAIETELDPLERLAVICRVNGEVRQAGFTSDLVFGVAEIIEFVTAVMTLLPGDVILTGTPSGVGPVEPGDLMEVEIDGIGTLANQMVAV